MIYTYIQQTVLARKSSHIKVPSQVFSRKQYEYGTHRKNDSLTRKFVKNHHMVVASLVKHPPPETSRIYLTLPPPPPPPPPPPSPLARDVISGWPLMHSSMIFSFSRKNQKFVISLIKVLCGKDVPKIKKQLIYTMKNFKWFRLNSLKLILESFKKFLGDKTCYEHILKINLTCVQSSDDVTLLGVKNSLSSLRPSINCMLYGALENFSI